MKKIFKLFAEFGLIYALKYLINRILFKITRNHKYQGKYFNQVLNYLKRRYGSCLTDDFDGRSIPENYKVWVFWWQGEEKMPLIVKKCVTSIRQNFVNHQVVLITEQNLSDYAKIPDYILEKVKKGKITITHFSDIIRATLLSENGGVWIDATCFMTDSIEKELENKCFYTNKLQYDDTWMHGFVGKARWSAFFLAGSKKNPIFVNLKTILFEYWKNHNYLIDYFLVDYCIMLSYMIYPSLKKMIDDVPYNNPNLHGLSSALLDAFDNSRWENLRTNTSFYKLSWKEDYSKRVAHSFYDALILEED